MTLCNSLERHVAAFILKTTPRIGVCPACLTARCGDAVATLWGFLKPRGRVVGAPRARCKDAL